MKTIEQIKEEIGSQLNQIDQKLFSGSIITTCLKIARDNYGEEAKNQLIDEFGLETYGWKKQIGVIKRYGEFDVKIS